MENFEVDNGDYVKARETYGALNPDKGVLIRPGNDPRVWKSIYAKWPSLCQYVSSEQASSLVTKAIAAA